MTAIDFAAQVGNLTKAVDNHLGKAGVTVCKESYEAAGTLAIWIDYFRSSELTGICDPSIDGLAAAIVECTGCLSLGLVRPSIFSLRAQVDIGLAWLFFKDHPIEWSRVENLGEGFMLKRDVITYLEEYIPSFKSRFNALSSVRQRKEVDPYRLLSAHVHGQSSFVLPSLGGLEAMVDTGNKSVECVQLQREVSEYLNDIFLAYFADKWASLPTKLVDAATNRIGAEKTHLIFG